VSRGVRPDPTRSNPRRPGGFGFQTQPRISMSRLALIIALAASFLALAGCGKWSNLIEVEGTVTVNGQPLADGDISFFPADPQYGGEGGKIKDGKYRLKARPGKNKVEIRATREVAGKKMPSAAGPDAPADAVFESYLPKQYNEETTLEADVGAGKTNFPFELKVP